MNDTLQASTWVGEHHGARFERFVKLVAEESGEVIAEAKTTWCMLDAKSMKPTRIQDDVLSVLGK